MHRGDGALLHGRLAFFEPPDIGAEGHAVVAYLAFFLQVFEGLENIVSFNDVYARVVELVDVYVVGVQASEALFTGFPDELRLEVLGLFLVPDTGGESVEVVSDLGAQDDVMALTLKGLGHDFLIGAGTVLVGSVEEVYAQVQGLVDELNGLIFVNVAPPVADEGPCAESDLGYGKLGVGYVAVLHTGTAVPTASFIRLISA